MLKLEVKDVSFRVSMHLHDPLDECGVLVERCNELRPHIVALAASYVRRCVCQCA